MKTIIIGLVAGLVGGVMFSSLHSFIYPQPQLAVIDVDAVISEHLESVGSRELSDSQRDDLSQRAAEVLERAINTVEEKQGVILFVKPAVVSDLPDYTPFIRSVMEAEIDE